MLGSCGLLDEGYKEIGSKFQGEGSGRIFIGGTKDVFPTIFSDKLQGLSLYAAPSFEDI